jgi:hypothetical protein
MTKAYAVINYCDNYDHPQYTLLGIFSTLKLALDYKDSLLNDEECQSLNDYLKCPPEEEWYIDIREIDIDKGIDDIFKCPSMIYSIINDGIGNRL